MKRIMVIGSCGSGKSTLSRKLQSITNLPLYHLDQYYWKPNWTETSDEDWKAIVLDLAAKESWIIDGNFGSTMNLRLKRADTIIFMDLPTYKCLWRVLKRIWKYHGQVRPDMPEGCNERFDLDFLHYVATYNLLRRKKLLTKLEAYKEEKNVVILRNEHDIRLFLKSLTVS